MATRQQKQIQAVVVVGVVVVLLVVFSRRARAQQAAAVITPEKLASLASVQAASNVDRIDVVEPTEVVRGKGGCR